MKVRILTSIGGSPSYQRDQVVDLVDQIATVWVREGIAEPVTSKAPAENAMQAPSKAR